jgi:hypothetical protein
MINPTAARSKIPFSTPFCTLGAKAIPKRLLKKTRKEFMN